MSFGEATLSELLEDYKGLLSESEELLGAKIIVMILMSFSWQKPQQRLPCPAFLFKKSSLFPQRHIILFALLLQIQVFLFNFYWVK